MGGDADILRLFGLSHGGVGGRSAVGVVGGLHDGVVDGGDETRRLVLWTMKGEQVNR